MALHFHLVEFKSYGEKSPSDDRSKALQTYYDAKIAELTKNRDEEIAAYKAQIKNLEIMLQDREQIIQETRSGSTPMGEKSKAMAKFLQQQNEMMELEGSAIEMMTSFLMIDCS